VRTKSVRTKSVRTKSVRARFFLPTLAGSRAFAARIRVSPGRTYNLRPNAVWMRFIAVERANTFFDARATNLRTHPSSNTPLAIMPVKLPKFVSDVTPEVQRAVRFVSALARTSRR
jgi:hypothetical protein